MQKTIQNSSELLAEAVAVWGRQSQEGMLHEEIGEMMQALNKYNRNPNAETLEHLCEEIADVKIILSEIETQMPEGLIDRWIDAKLTRMRKRLDNTIQRRAENFKNALAMVGMRQNLFRALHDKGIIATTGDMDDIAEAITRDETESLDVVFEVVDNGLRPPESKL